MRLTTIAAVLISATVLAGPAHARVIAEFDLDALDTGQFFLGISLPAGEYASSLRSGKYTAWSAWDTTSENCTDDCPQGWLNFYGFFNVAENAGGYVENGVFTPFDQYDFSKRLAYSTPEAALAADRPFRFRLTAPTEVFFFIEDCPGCYANNRGGLSFTLESVPEPGSLALLGLGVMGLGLWRRKSA